MTHLYVDAELQSGAELVLPTASAHHLRTVLRLTVDTELSVFNGRGEVYGARVLSVTRERVVVLIGTALALHTESPLAVTLVQSISRGERMDYTLQKAVELGVARIVPVISQRTVVRLDAKRQGKRLEHWRGVVQHAAEQSQRCRLPELAPIVSLEQWAQEAQGQCSFVLHPHGAEALTQQPAPGNAAILIAGPEGGFAASEITMLSAAGARPVALGPRILRTETAALCALAVMQALWGDLAG